MAVGHGLLGVIGPVVAVLFASCGISHFAQGQLDMRLAGMHDGPARTPQNSPQSLVPGLQNGIGRMPLVSQQDVMPGRLQELGVPENADILFVAQSDCPEPLPQLYKGRAFQLCAFIRGLRACLGRTEHDPLFSFPKCSRPSNGCEPMVFTHEETICTAGLQRRSFPPQNTSEETRCQVPEALWDFFRPQQLPFNVPIAGDPVSLCHLTLAESSKRTVQIACEDGRPRFHYKWDFDFPEDAGDGIYSCTLDGMCPDDGPNDPSEISLCYRDQGEAALTRETGSKSGASPTCLASTLWISFVVASVAILAV